MAALPNVLKRVELVLDDARLLSRLLAAIRHGELAFAAADASALSLAFSHLDVLSRELEIIFTSPLFAGALARPETVGTVALSRAYIKRLREAPREALEPLPGAPTLPEGVGQARGYAWAEQIARTLAAARKSDWAELQRLRALNEAALLVMFFGPLGLALSIESLARHYPELAPFAEALNLRELRNYVEEAQEKAKKRASTIATVALIAGGVTATALVSAFAFRLARRA